MSGGAAEENGAQDERGDATLGGVCADVGWVVCGCCEVRGGTYSHNLLGELARLLSSIDLAGDLSRLLLSVNARLLGLLGLLLPLLLLGIVLE